jgi:hypothetical protein
MPESLHKLIFSKVVLGHMGIGPIGGLLWTHKEKGRVFGYLDQRFTGLQTSAEGCSLPAAEFSWPSPFLVCSAGMWGWHLGLMNTPCKFSAQSAALCWVSPCYIAKSLVHLPSGYLAQSLHPGVVGSCHVGTKESLGIIPSAIYLGTFHSIPTGIKFHPMVSCVSCPQLLYQTNWHIYPEGHAQRGENGTYSWELSCLAFSLSPWCGVSTSSCQCATFL